MRLSREMRLASGRCVRRCSTKSGGSDLPGIGTYEAVMPSSEHLTQANRYSSVITQRKSQGAGQAQLYATDVGKIAGGMKKPQVGISSVWYEGNPCNMHLLDVAGCVKTAVQALDMVGLRFNSIGDGIETVMGAQFYDANISVPGCDKNMPGCLMAMARVNRPSVMVYGGTIRAGY